MAKQHSDVIGELDYLGFDEREDFTLMEGGRVQKENHITFVGLDGQYINHLTPDGKTGEKVCQKIFEVLEETDSLTKLKVIASDGTGES